MADVVIDIEAKDSTRSGIKSAETGLERLGREGKEALDKIDEAAEEASEGVEGIGSSAGAAGKVIAGLGVAGAIAGVAIVGNFLGSATELTNLSKRTGLSTTALQRFGYAADLSGSSIDAVVGLTGTLSERLLEVEAGSEDVAAQFAGLGLDAKELQRLSPEEQFLALADAIAAVEDPSERLGRAQMLLGGEAGELLPLLVGGSDAVRALGDELVATGNIMSQDTVASAAQVSEEINLAKQAIIGLAADGFAALLPHIETFVMFVNTNVVPAVRGFIDVVAIIFQWIVDTEPVLAALGVVLAGALVAGLVAATVAVYTWAAALVAAAIAQAAAFAPILLIVGGIALLVAAVVLIIQHWDTLKRVAIAVWDRIKFFLLAAVAIILGPLGAIIIAGVLVIKHWETIRDVAIAVWDRIKEAFQTAVDFIVGIVEGFRDSVVTLFTNIKDAVTTAVTTTRDSVVTAFEYVKTTVTTAVTTVRKSITTAFNTIKTSMTTAVTTARDAVVTAFEFVRDTVTGAIETTRDTVLSVWTAVVNGMIGGANAMVGAVEGAINAIIKGINSVTSLWNAISFTTPSIFGVGGQTIGVPQIGAIPLVSIRRVATIGGPCAAVGRVCSAHRARDG